MFTIIFNRPKSDENETKTRVKTREKTRWKTRGGIIRLISENKNVTINLLSEKTNVSLKTIEFHLSNLKKRRKNRAFRSRYWRVLDCERSTQKQIVWQKTNCVDLVK
jgi:predicted HTH transcriptional regulator